MSEEFKLPDLGEGVHEGRIVSVMVSEGQEVQEDVPLIEVETDKASVEIPCPHTGLIEKVFIEEGQLVHVGDVMVTFADSGATGGDGARAAAPSAGNNGGGSSATTTVESVVPVTAPPAPTTKGHKPASPAVRKYARQLGIDLNTINGTGPRGRVTKADVDRAAHAPSPAPSASVPAATTAPPAVPVAPSIPVPAPTPVPYTAQSVPAASLLPDDPDEQDSYGTIRRHQISQARKTIANNMYQSWTTTPHVTDFDFADVTDLDRLRRGYPSEENAGRKITMLAFVVRAVATALQTHPIFNAVFDGERDEIIYKRYVNIAIGVQTDRGLLAPVIRNVEQMHVAQIADAIVAMANKVRTGKVEIADMRGGTYTVSNAGAFGGSWFSTPIITPGQGAVLALGMTRKMPWVVDDEIVPRLIMPLSHTFDHRLADGAQEVAFLKQVIGALENPARLLM
jgi:pyruvate/2-oxoglutarate dehydrogenase complex dihydrolipoamide acyltransferase (E2) component